MVLNPRTTFSTNPSKDIKGVDLVIVPGGNLSRVDYLASLLPVNVPIILTGKRFILDSSTGKPQSHVAKDYLIDIITNSSFNIEKPQDPNELNIFCEDNSVDWISAAFYTTNDVYQILSGSNSKNVGIFVEKDHMPTFTHCLDWVLDKNISFTAFPTDVNSSPVDKIKSSISIKPYSFLLRNAWNLDLRKHHHNLGLYVVESHPTLGNNPDSPAYSKLINTYKWAFGYKEK